MFSTMMTVASTTRPKSIAPTDSRLADSPRITIRPIANDSANGIVVATLIALRTGRQHTGAVDMVDLGLDAPDGGDTLGATTHEYDTLDDIVVGVEAGD